MSAAGTGSLLTAPNLLSLARLPLGGLFWLTLAHEPDNALLPFAVLGLAAVTDVLDGYLARRQAGGTDPQGMGSWLDPICDKLFVGAVLGSIYVERRPPLALLALIVTRELLQLPMAVIYRASTTLRRWLRYDFRASVLGKAATVAQFLAVSALILNHRIAWTMAVIAFAVGLLALADYVRRAILIGKRRLEAEEERPR